MGGSAGTDEGPPAPALWLGSEGAAASAGRAVSPASSGGGSAAAEEGGALGPRAGSTSGAEEGASQYGDTVRLKASCEQCASAKVRCSGEIPCARCVGKGVECEYVVEKKRGRRVPTEASSSAKVKKKKKKAPMCTDASCWGQVVINPINKVEDFGARFGLSSVERRVFQIFFALYKHHATPQSCCREWFTFQLNKMRMFLLSNGNREGQLKLDQWMASKGIEVQSREPGDFAMRPRTVVLEEGTGRVLPPTLSAKGPKFRLTPEMKLAVDEAGAAPAGGGAGDRKPKKGAQLYTTNRQVCVPGKIGASPLDQDIERMRTEQAFLFFSATHEEFEIEVNRDFTALFGYTTRNLIVVMERLFGGLLPWSCDLLALLLADHYDLLLFMRMLAMQLNAIGRPAQFPATRQVQCSHIFDLVTESGDVVECAVSCILREFLSVERTEVNMYFGFRPTVAGVPRRFERLAAADSEGKIDAAAEGGGSKLTSRPGLDSSVPGQPPRQVQLPALVAGKDGDDQDGEDGDGDGDDGDGDGPASNDNNHHSQAAEGASCARTVSAEGLPTANELDGVEFLDFVMDWANNRPWGDVATKTEQPWGCAAEHPEAGAANKVTPLANSKPFQTQMPVQAPLQMAPLPVYMQQSMTQQQQQQQQQQMQPMVTFMPGGFVQMGYPPGQMGFPAAQTQQQSFPVMYNGGMPMFYVPQMPLQVLAQQDLQQLKQPKQEVPAQARSPEPPA
jgi:hypothetical protein